MKHEYYKNYNEVVGNGKWKGQLYCGFPKEKLNVQIIRELLKKKYLDNRIILTENLIVFSQWLSNNSNEDRKESKKIFQKMRMIENVIIFSPMSYREYKVTKSAKNIIIENNVNEKNFDCNSFISIHENKLSIEVEKKSFDISLEIENINVELEKMKEERNKEIEQRILECLK